jgi:hypothetical protein
MNIPNGEWRLQCPAELFGTLKEDKEFVFLVSLARLVSVVKFYIAAKDGVLGDTSPAAERQHMVAFYQLSGVLHEILEFQRKTEAEWSGLSAYQYAFRPFTGSDLDKHTRELLTAIRNRAAFHFDIHVASTQLRKLPDEEYTLASSVGRNHMALNYEISDFVTFSHMFGSLQSDGVTHARLSRFRKLTWELIDQFMQRADDVAITRLIKRGCRVVPLGEGTFAQEYADLDLDSLPD